MSRHGLSLGGRPFTRAGRGQGRDKAQKEQQDWRARGEGVMSPLHARTAPAGHAWKWRDSPYNCRALTATVRNSLRRAEESTVVAPSSVGMSAYFRFRYYSTHSVSQAVSRCIARTEFGSQFPVNTPLLLPAPLASSWNFRFAHVPSIF